MGLKSGGFLFCWVSGSQNLKKSAAFLSKISFQDFPPLIGSAFAFVAELDGIFSQIDFGYIPVCEKGETQQAWLHKQRARVLWRGTLWKRQNDSQFENCGLKSNAE